MTEPVRASSAAAVAPDLPSAAGAGPSPKLVEAAQAFEAYFLRLMLGEMQRTVGEGGLFRDRSMRAYGDMLNDALASRAAEAGSFGLARQLLGQLGRIEEAGS